MINLQAMYSNVFYNKLMCSSTLKRDKNLHDHIVSAKCKQGSHRLVLKNFNDISRKKSQISMRILNKVQILLLTCLTAHTGCFYENQEASYLICLTPPTGGQHCINLHPDHHRMCCWTKPACPMWQGMWHLRYELHAVIATKERKSINWNLSQYQKTTFQGIPIVNIRQPETVLSRIELLHSESEAGIHQLLRFLLKWGSFEVEYSITDYLDI